MTGATCSNYCINMGWRCTVSPLRWTHFISFHVSKTLILAQQGTLQYCTSTMVAATATSFSISSSTTKKALSRHHHHQQANNVSVHNLSFISSSNPSLKSLRAHVARAVSSASSSSSKGGVLGATMVSSPASVKPLSSVDFETSVFKKEKINLAGHEEVYFILFFVVVVSVKVSDSTIFFWLLFRYCYLCMYDVFW